MQVISLDEYADLPEGVSSEERLKHFSSGTWSPQLCFQKAIELRENAKLEVQVVSDMIQLPGLGSETEFSYAHCSYVTCFDRQRPGKSFWFLLC